MRRLAVVASVIGLAGTARADDATLAEAHASSSTTVYLSSPWSPGPTVPIRIGSDGAVRVHQWHLAFEGRFGFAGAGSLTGFGMELAGHLGASIGVAVALGERVVVSPMLAYDGFAMWEKGDGTTLVHYATIEIPVAIVLRPGVVLEPFLQLGFARFHGASDPAIVIGPRIGVTVW